MIKTITREFNVYDAVIYGTFEYGTLGYYMIEFYSTADKIGDLPRHAVGFYIQWPNNFKRLRIESGVLTIEDL